MQDKDAGYKDLVKRTGARLRSKPPLVINAPENEGLIRSAFTRYTDTDSDGRRLLAHFRLADVAMRVVGVGSVGALNAIGLFASEQGSGPKSVLILELREAIPPAYVMPQHNTTHRFVPTAPHRSAG